MRRKSTMRLVRTTRKCGRAGNEVEAREVQVGAIRCYDGPRFGRQHIKYVYVAGPARRESGIGYDGATRVQRVYLDRHIGVAKSRSRGRRRPQIDNGGVESVETVVENQCHLFPLVRRGGSVNLVSGEVGIGHEVATSAGVGR